MKVYKREIYGILYVEYQQTLMLKGSSQLKHTADLSSTQLTAEGTKMSPHVGNWIKPHQSGHSFLLHLFFLTPCLLFSSVCNFFFLSVAVFFFLSHWKRTPLDGISSKPTTDSYSRYILENGIHLRQWTIVHSCSTRWVLRCVQLWFDQKRLWCDSSVSLVHLNKCKRWIQHGPNKKNL